MKKITYKETLDQLLIFLPLSRSVLKAGEFTNKHGIMHAHMRVLLLLYTLNATSTTQIGKLLEISKPNVTPLIDKLIVLGFVQREPDQSDRRVIKISITEAGRRYADEMYDAMYENAQTAFSALSEDEINSLNGHLRAANDILAKLSPHKIHI